MDVASDAAGVVRLSVVLDDTAADSGGDTLHLSLSGDRWAAELEVQASDLQKSPVTDMRLALRPATLNTALHGHRSALHPTAVLASLASLLVPLVAYAELGPGAAIAPSSESLITVGSEDRLYDGIKLAMVRDAHTQQLARAGISFAETRARVAPAATQPRRHDANRRGLASLQSGGMKRRVQVEQAYLEHILTGAELGDRRKPHQSPDGRLRPALCTPPPPAAAAMIVPGQVGCDRACDRKASLTTRRMKQRSTYHI